MSEGSSRDHAAHHPPAHAIDRLIEGLVTDLRPAPPLAAPLARALGWSTLVLAAGAVLALRADLGSLATRMAVPDLSLAALGSGLTAFAAAVAAFQTSVPGRGARWALLPLPPAALWIGASGLGCLRGWALPGMVPTTPEVMGTCLSFILIVSLPLSAFLMLMLRRACPLRPGLTAALGGLAAAAAAATLLVFFHPTTPPPSTSSSTSRSSGSSSSPTACSAGASSRRAGEARGRGAGRSPATRRDAEVTAAAAAASEPRNGGAPRARRTDRRRP